MKLVTHNCWSSSEVRVTTELSTKTATNFPSTTTDASNNTSCTNGDDRIAKARKSISDIKNDHNIELKHLEDRIISMGKSVEKVKNKPKVQLEKTLSFQLLPPQGEKIYVKKNFGPK